MQDEQFQLHAEIEDRHWWFLGRRKILCDLTAALPSAGNERLIVDVGCGTGANAAALEGLGRVVGVDPSAAAIAHAQQRFGQVEFRQGFAPQAVADLLPTTDVLLLADVIEHVSDDFEFLSRLLQPLPPGAHVLLTTPADPRLWSTHDESFGHYRRYERDRLQAVWAGLPVRERLLSGCNVRLAPIVRCVRWLAQQRGQSAGAAGTDFSVPRTWLNRGLQTIFGGESGRLVRCLAEQSRPYPSGVSWVAVLERLPGQVQVRTRPVAVPADVHVPRCAA